MPPSSKPRNRKRSGRKASSADRSVGIEETVTMRRRDVLKLFAAATLSGALSRPVRSADDAAIYDLEQFGNVRVLHLTDTHAQLLPVHFREPSVNLGIGAMQGRPPHLVGRHFLDGSVSNRRAAKHTLSPIWTSRRRRSATVSSAASRISRRWSIGCAATFRPAHRFCSTVATCGRAAGSRTPCRAPTWSRPQISSASRR